VISSPHRGRIRGDRGKQVGEVLPRHAEPAVLPRAYFSDGSTTTSRRWSSTGTTTFRTRAAAGVPIKRRADGASS